MWIWFVPLDRTPSYPLSKLLDHMGCLVWLAMARVTEYILSKDDSLGYFS